METMRKVVAGLVAITACLIYAHMVESKGETLAVPG
jgi:hypothetical protein